MMDFTIGRRFTPVRIHSIISALLLLLPLAHAADRFICGAVTDNSAANPRTICGYAGQVKGKAAQTFQATGFANCRDTCLVDRKCAAFSFNFDSTACNTYHKTLKKLHFKTAGTDDYFWATSCFVVEGYAPVYPVVNGDFETGDLSHWPGTDTDAVTVRASNSTPPNYFALMSYTYPQGATDPVIRKFLRQQISLCNGTAYIVTFRFNMVPGGTIVIKNQRPPVAEVGIFGPDSSPDGDFLQAYLSTNSSFDVNFKDYPAGVDYGSNSTLYPPTTGLYTLAAILSVFEPGSKGSMGFDNFVFQALV